MEQVKFYKYATIFLVLLNISMVAFFLITKPKGRPHHRNQAPKILELDKTQNTAFLKYADTHKALMKGFNKEQKTLLKTYFQTLTDTTNITITDSLLTQIQVLERQKIESTYEHLKEVKTILNEEQQPRFQKFMNQVYKVILMENRKK